MLATTTHDRPIGFGGYICISHESTNTRAVEKTASLDPNNVELRGIQGALGQDVILTGRLSYKTIQSFKGVDWRNPPTDIGSHPANWIQVGTAGEVTIEGQTTWLIQDQSSVERKLSQSPNKITSPVCRHLFCDSGCQLNIASHEFLLEITEVFHQMAFRVNYSPPDYSFGIATFTGEPNANTSYPVISGQGGIIQLGDLPEGKLAIGQTVKMTRGCAKTIGYCRTVYGNSINFGGIPPEEGWIPGNNKYHAPDIQRG